MTTTYLENGMLIPRLSDDGLVRCECGCVHRREVGCPRCEWDEERGDGE